MIMRYIKKLARRILQWELMNEYMSGWHDGVEQHMHDPSSCHPIKREAWLTHAEYWEEE